jgi:hypothetical protein
LGLSDQIVEELTSDIVTNLFQDSELLFTLLGGSSLSHLTHSSFKGLRLLLLGFTLSNKLLLFLVSFLLLLLRCELLRRDAFTFLLLFIIFELHLTSPRILLAYLLEVGKPRLKIDLSLNIPSPCSLNLRDKPIQFFQVCHGSLLGLCLLQ